MLIEGFIIHNIFRFYKVKLICGTGVLVCGPVFLYGICGTKEDPYALLNFKKSYADMSCGGALKNYVDM